MQGAAARVAAPGAGANDLDAVHGRRTVQPLDEATDDPTVEERVARRPIAQRIAQTGQHGTAVVVVGQHDQPGLGAELALAQQVAAGDPLDHAGHVGRVATLGGPAGRGAGTGVGTGVGAAAAAARPWRG